MTLYAPALSKYFPVRRGWSMALSTGVSAAVGLASVVLGTTILKEYGWALFLGVPLVMGVVGPLIYGMGARR